MYSLNNVSFTLKSTIIAESDELELVPLLLEDELTNSYSVLLKFLQQQLLPHSSVDERSVSLSIFTKKKVVFSIILVVAKM